jgi:hypothetical protein
MPKRWRDLSNDELREVHLALALRLAELTKTDTRKMGPNARADIKRRVDICRELDDTAQKARGK